MPNATNAIISVHDRYANSFRSGRKTVELRRRFVHFEPGTHVWIYSKLPQGKVRLIGIVEEVFRGSPEAIWQQFGPQTGITREEFAAYFRNREEGCAIRFKEFRQLSPSIHLDDIRHVSSQFHPPQFVKFLPSACPELKLLRSSKKLRTTHQ